MNVSWRRKQASKFQTQAELNPAARRLAAGRDALLRDDSESPRVVQIEHRIWEEHVVEDVEEIERGCIRQDVIALPPGVIGADGKTDTPGKKCSATAPSPKPNAETERPAPANSRKSSY